MSSPEVPALRQEWEVRTVTGAWEKEVHTDGPSAREE